ncbi:MULTISPECIES: class I SAM-dependent methyltransferase [Nostocales]|uniref:Methyltransferase domain-containing protein n=3 Tax=Nostocales TaxID=1161 RepID=A0A0C1NDD0_9CYAN|nr:class I SAM-dependent methyltransferase [Tolypothrix bouteillei]KAF3888301.1 methyltransferase domain-containing protein [Tolypothrix bouteillei VB521301]
MNNLEEQDLNSINNQTNRYAKDWNQYSQTWEEEFGNKYSYLGEEWNDDDTLERKRDNFYFTMYAERFLRAEQTVLEVGPGGGKWTVRIAPKVKKLIVLDVSEEMLKRTKERCESLGIFNVEYVLANGFDFHQIPNESIDFFFSFDVFVHIALEDTFPYTQEIYRVLTPGAEGVCHYAINSVPESWERIEENNQWYQGGKCTLGQYYYHSPDSLRRMVEYCQLIMKEQHQEAWNCVCVFQKPKKVKRTSSQSQDNSREIEQLELKLQQTQEKLKHSQSLVKELQNSKIWLQSQYEIWKQQAEENQRQWEDSQAWIQKLQAGKEWLEIQYHNWKQKAEEAQPQIERLEFQLQQTQAKLEQSLERLQQIQVEQQHSQSNSNKLL